MKKCSTCKQLKDESSFNKNSRNKDGLNSCCKQCKADLDKRSAQKRKNLVRNVPDFKVCFKCKETHSKDGFIRKNLNSDGLSSYCKYCIAKDSNKTYEKRKQKEKVFVDNKQCNDCKNIKEASEFYSFIGSIDGLNNICIECDKERKRKDRLNNPDKYKKYAKTDRKKNAASYARRNKKWRDNNREQMQQIRRNWNIANPDKIIAKKLRRSQREKEQSGYIPKNHREILLKIFGNICPSCLCEYSESNKATVDHVIPLAFGTQETKLHSMANFQLLCTYCNCSKMAFKETDYRTIEQLYILSEHCYSAV